MKTIKTIFCIGIAVLLLTATQLLAATITDDAGQTLNFETPPARVASLVSAATEVMAAIGAADHLAGRMYHDAHMPGLADKPVFGGGFTPQWDLIAKAGPDLVIVAPRQLNQAKAELPNTPLLVWDDGASLAQADLKIGWLGDIFQKTAEAEAVRQGNRDFLDLIAQKTARIPEERRLRVIRVLQDESGLLTPGEDSFQTELIAAAGGIPPKMGPGSFVPLNLEAWKKFNPQVIYACGTGRAELMKFLEQPGWNEAEAVQNKNVQYFPCALTCRAATHTGYFAAWFSSLIYGDHFADRSQLVLPEGLLGEKPVPVDMPYVKKSAIVESRLFDFVHRTLLIDFKSPRLIVSSDGGQKTVSTVGNAFSPPPTWGLSHKLGFRQVQEDRLRVLKLNPQSVDILGTGADMNNLVVKSAAFKDLKVTALRAGVADKRNTARTERPYTSWNAFLQHLAAQGQETALAILRSKKVDVQPEPASVPAPQAISADHGPDQPWEEQRQKIMDTSGLSDRHRRALLTVVKMRELLEREAEPGGTSQELRFRIDTKGTVIFSLLGGTIRDNGREINFSAHDESIKELAFKFAKMRWGKSAAVSLEGNRICVEDGKDSPKISRAFGR